MLPGITKEGDINIGYFYGPVPIPDEDRKQLTMFWNWTGTACGSSEFWIQCVAQTEKEVSGQPELTGEPHQIHLLSLCICALSEVNHALIFY